MSPSAFAVETVPSNVRFRGKSGRVFHSGTRLFLTQSGRSATASSQIFDVIIGGRFGGAN